MPLSKQVDQPHYQYTPPKPRKPRLKYKRNTDIPCPKCGFYMGKGASLCISCQLAANRPPRDPAIYAIKGERCRKIALTRGQYMTVSEVDYATLSLWNWIADWSEDTGTWYAATFVTINGKQVVVRPHHIIFQVPTSCRYDHIVRTDTLNNTRGNLRPCTAGQNACNQRKRHTNSSGYIGVQIRDSGKKWRARITRDGTRVNLGDYDSPEEAARVRDQAAIIEYGEFANLNFPIEDE